MQLVYSAIEGFEHTGSARPDLQWRRACQSSIRPGQGPAGSQTPQELLIDAHGLSVSEFRMC
jgi:hypothetical protein